MYEDLSNIQIKIIEFLKEQIRSLGYPPSVREIGAHVGLASTSSVHNQLNNLAKKGYIRRDSLKQRAIEIIDEDKEDVVYVPVVGKVTAGIPITAVENIEDTFPLPKSFAGDNDCFMLNVSGESMVGVGILDGDILIVKKQSTAYNRDIVVAMIDEEATVKTFYKEKDRIRLQPENPDFEPIYSDKVTILGKVIGVFRHM